MNQSNIGGQKLNYSNEVCYFLLTQVTLKTKKSNQMLHFPLMSEKRSILRTVVRLGTHIKIKKKLKANFLGQNLLKYNAQYVQNDKNVNVNKDLKGSFLS